NRSHAGTYDIRMEKMVDILAQDDGISTDRITGAEHCTQIAGLLDVLQDDDQRCFRQADPFQRKIGFFYHGKQIARILAVYEPGKQRMAQYRNRNSVKFLLMESR